MSDTNEFHPDDLLDRLREGALDDDARARLDAHLVWCMACRIEARMVRDFAGEGAAREGDDLLIARAIREADPSRPSSRPRRRTMIVFAIAAALAVVSVVWAARLAVTPSPPREGMPAAQDEEVVEVPTVATTTTTTSDLPPAVTILPTAPNDPVLAPPKTVAPRPTPTSASVPRPTPPSASVPATAADPEPETAAQIFAKANEARGRGDAQEAQRLYRDLQARFPASAEARTSRVALAKLLLPTDPVGARREASAYLAGGDSGTLAEEAQVLLATACQAIGDHAGERRAWKALLDRHPGSIHEARARKRLEALGP